MKIVSLTAENIKRLVAVEIRPEDNFVEITGRNGSGKTSVLDSIWWALGGTRGHQKKPIRDGETRARITLDLGDIIVKRTFRENDEGRVTTSIIVENDEQARFPSPQKMLDDLLGSLSFDPLVFARMDPGLQYDVIKDMCGLDFESMKEASQKDYDERTIQNRLAKASRASADGIEVPADTPNEKHNIPYLVNQLSDGEARNRERQQAITLSEARGFELLQCHETVADKEGQISLLQDEIVGIKATILDIQNALTRDPPPPDLFVAEPVENAIFEAEGINKDIENRARKREHIEASRAADKLSDELTNRLNKRVRDSKKMIEEADMPVEGLSLDKGQVIYNGIPLAQASDAEQLRVSCAIAMRDNTELRVIRVRDGSLLDDDSLSILRQMADDADFQVWIERVDMSGKIGFVIEDGQLKEGS